MPSKYRTGFGVYDRSRQVARRVQQEWELIETSPPARDHAEIIPFPPPEEPWPPAAAIQSQPLAA